ncbi:hypothetical protein FO519_006035 [Halicephalobus sp. NKZ332]|nr:hypothetical protein FO519_006035 [Halicephalobus sp. NKZ332]
MSASSSHDLGFFAGIISTALLLLASVNIMQYQGGWYIAWSVLLYVAIIPIICCTWIIGLFMVWTAYDRYRRTRAVTDQFLKDLESGCVVSTNN